jgi:molecular chaperone GrpE
MNKKVSKNSAKDELQALKEQLFQAEELKIRALADLENFRRRESENKKNWSNLAIAEFCRSQLKTFLELQMGVQHSTDEDVKKVVTKFFSNLSTSGLNMIEPKPGETIDPDKHEVLMAESGDNPGTIVQVLEPGWQFQETILAPAKVSAVSN